MKRICVYLLALAPLVQTLLSAADGRTVSLMVSGTNNTAQVTIQDQETFRVISAGPPYNNSFQLIAQQGTANVYWDSLQLQGGLDPFWHVYTPLARS